MVELKELLINEDYTYKCTRCGNTEEFHVDAKVDCVAKVNGNGEFLFWRSENFENPDMDTKFYCAKCKNPNPVGAFPVGEDTPDYDIEQSLEIIDDIIDRWKMGVIDPKEAMEAIAREIDDWTETEEIIVEGDECFKSLDEIVSEKKSPKVIHLNRIDLEERPEIKFLRSIGCEFPKPKLNFPLQHFICIFEEVCGCINVEANVAFLKDSIKEGKYNLEEVEAWLMGVSPVKRFTAARHGIAALMPNKMGMPDEAADVFKRAEAFKPERFEGLHQDVIANAAGDEVTIYYGHRRHEIEKELKPGAYVYEIRHTDEDHGEPSTIEEHVVVNFYGTLVTPNPINFRGKGYVDYREYMQNGRDTWS